MKKYIIIALALLLLIPQGCKKYEEGPWFSINSSWARLTEKKWTLWSYKVNGIEKIIEYNDSCGCKISFSIYEPSRIDIFHAFGKKGSLYSEFELTDNEKIINVYTNNGYHLDFDSYSYETPILPLDSTVESVVWEIKKLSNKNLKLVTNYKNNNYEIELYN